MMQDLTEEQVMALARERDEAMHRQRMADQGMEDPSARIFEEQRLADRAAAAQAPVTTSQAQLNADRALVEQARLAIEAERAQAKPKTRREPNKAVPSQRTLDRAFQAGLAKGEDTNRPGLLNAGASTYTVERGDSLWKIANRLGVKVEDLVRDNRIANPELIKPGQVLKLRTAAAEPTAPTTPTAPAGPSLVAQKIQADQAQRAGRTPVQLAGELYQGFGRNPNNVEALESGAMFGGAVAGGAGAAALVPRAGGLLAGMLRRQAPAPGRLGGMSDAGMDMLFRSSTIRRRR